MGGRVPFGYRNQDKKLIVDETQAETVREIFELYQELRNVRLVKAELYRRSIRSRKTIKKNGEVSSGKAFSTGNLYTILKNPIYAGMIRHKEKVYSGNHNAIIEPNIWDEVQHILTCQKSTRTQNANQQSPALLKGLLFDHRDNKLLPHHANKKGKRYHYYVSEKRNNEDKIGGNRSKRVRLPMLMIERIVKDVMIDTLNNQTNLLSQHNKGLDAETIQSLSVSTNSLAKTLSAASRAKLKILYAHLIHKIIIGKDKISIILNSEALSGGLTAELNAQNVVQITKPICLKRRGQELKLVIGDRKPNPSNPNHALIGLIANAHLLRIELESGDVGSIKEFAIKYKMDHGDAKNLIPLGYLAPSIVEEILVGQQLAELTVRQLKSVFNLPILWDEQRRHLGFVA